MRAVLATAVLAALAAAAPPPAAAAPPPEGGRPPQPVRVETLRSRTIQDRRRVTGELRAVLRSLVPAREDGRILEMPVREGDRVEAGATLARIDDERLRLESSGAEAEKRAADAAVEVRKSEVGKAKRDRDTLEELAGKQAANPKEFADAESEWRTALARVAEAEARSAVLAERLALLRVRREDTIVKAPFAGMVVRKAAERGQWVSQGDPVAELVSVDDLEARVEVPQGLLAALRDVDAPVEVRVDATGETFAVKERRLVLDVDARSRTFRAVLPLPRGAGLAPGMSVTAAVPAGAAAEHLVVSRSAILRNETGPYIFVAEGGGAGAPAAARMVAVEVLFGVGDGAAVRSPGLAAGARVVVEGNERLHPGAPLLPEEREGAGGGDAPAKEGSSR